MSDEKTVTAKVAAICLVFTVIGALFAVSLIFISLLTGRTYIELFTVGEVISGSGAIGLLCTKFFER